ncbi:conserved Plasmodium protein, unknown function [Plasmodium knowlesi strain H]|uniref:Heptatricopeptide repeat-containing protein n=3 Tax=Plasmodium knowlesi TaxID=5850 RepID=A0A5K1UVJ1_PLAKH|nr:conserved Plasmodium protein, unknown function [Plasmodium knowlesi strain H]OTN67423.1 Uncharacterized protein PKNOH_S06420300 [Plasmodium knowlesi]CAA9987476.1 conserved Plasmodium protein, unknown function [Plasmodium knowlesi strain H]SBO23206.1 conserved Plasmodium protein, unknown function [Plasmodium knowlesi strain H]SBO23963.1 conserved Plasmodium protein, unknown function [Plasmodium knowlesi strain H]VVS76950.1 conserved Plasmodium protein, unknown function [Plasmodium knowlesi s|eukprot:XP_002258477.1 hypothetical protein, conserved in Plasmodium species [Plasmodium knowlesi strain H]
MLGTAFYVAQLLLLLTQIFECRKRHTQQGYLNGIAHRTPRHEGRSRINKNYLRKKKKDKEKEYYENFFRELDKIFNDEDDEQKKVEEEERRKEEEMDAISEKDLLEVNFCNYERDPRSLANLVKNRTEHEEGNREDADRESSTKGEPSSDEVSMHSGKKETMPYSYDYERVLKGKEYLPEKILLKEKFSVEEDEEKLVDRIDVNTMNDFLSNYQNNFQEPFYKGRRDRYFGREDLQRGNSASEVGEEKMLRGAASAEVDIKDGDIGEDQLESVHFLRNVRREFDRERDCDMDEAVRQVEGQFVQGNVTGDGNRNYNKDWNSDGGEMEGGLSFEKHVEEEIKRRSTDDETVDKLIRNKFIDMFKVDDAVKKTNEQIKKSQSVSALLELFSEKKPKNIINIMYMFMYIYRFQNANMMEYIYDRRFAFLTDTFEQVLKFYLYMFRKNMNCSGEKKKERTVVLNSRNIIFLLKYMNRLKLFYVNLNIYNLLFLIMSQSLDMFSIDSLVVLLAYLNEYSYYGNEVHKKINLSILKRIFELVRVDRSNMSRLHFGHFKLLVPLLVKHRYVGSVDGVDDAASLLLDHFAKDTQRAIESVQSGKAYSRSKDICDILFYDSKTKEQKKNKENYMAYLENQQMQQRKKDIKFLYTFLQYLMIGKFAHEEETVQRLVDLFLGNLSLFQVEDVMTIFFNSEQLQYGEQYSALVNRCKNELLQRKSLLKDFQINQVLSFFILGYRRSLLYRDYHRRLFSHARYVLRRDQLNRGENPNVGIVDTVPRLLSCRSEMRTMHRKHLLSNESFRDPQFLYDFTHDIHIFVKFKNVHLLKFVYNMYLLSLLYYKNADVLRIVSEVSHDLIETNIFSFIDQYAYYMYEDLYIIIKAFKYVSFFQIDLIEPWKKFFFLLEHFSSALNLENIYDIFFFINICNLQKLKCENYNVFRVLTERMKRILEILAKHDLHQFSTHPHTYLLNILNLVREKQNEHMCAFAQTFFYSVYTRLCGDWTDNTSTGNISTDNNTSGNTCIDPREAYRKVNRRPYNFRDARLFLQSFLAYHNEKQQHMNLPIVHFILLNVEDFFSQLRESVQYYHSSYIYGAQMEEFLSLIRQLVYRKLYNGHIMRTLVLIIKHMIHIQEIHNGNDYDSGVNIFKPFFAHFPKVTDANVWRFIRRHPSLSFYP